MHRFGFFKISSENDVQVIREELQGYFFFLCLKNVYTAGSTRMHMLTKAGAPAVTIISIIRCAYALT